MAQFKLKAKAFGKEAMKGGMEVGLITLGALGTAKFADFKTLFPKADPEGFFIKHQGLVKAGGAIAAIAAFPKMPIWLKLLIVGLGVEGAIREARVLTSESGFFVQVGQGNGGGNQAVNQAMLEAAKAVTQEYPNAVARLRGDNPLVSNSNSGVAALTMSNMMNSSTKVYTSN